MADGDRGGAGETPPAATASSSGTVGRLQTAAYLIGSAGLLLATAADSIAVAGRHLGFRLLGSIEVVQAAVVLVASSAMVIATLVGSHASVHIFTQRASPATGADLRRFANLISLIFFALLTVASVWVAAELWHGFERSELLGIPLRWLRLVWIIALVLITVLFMRGVQRQPR